MTNAPAYSAAVSITAAASLTVQTGNTYLRGKYHCTIDLLFDWFGIGCITTCNFCFYLQNIQIQTSQIGGQEYSDTFPFRIPWPYSFTVDWSIKRSSLFNCGISDKAKSLTSLTAKS